MYLQPVRYPSVFGGGLVVSVGEDKAPGSISAQWSIGDERCDRTYSSRIKVQTATPQTGPLAVINALGVRIGDSYRYPIFSLPATESDTGSFVNAIRAEMETDDGRQWAVTLEYSPYDVVSLLGNSYVGQGIIDPLDRALEVYWGEPAKYTRYKPEDESTPDPLPFLNTAKDPLLDPPPTEETRPVLFVVRNESTYNDAYASQYKDTTNADEFLGYPPNVVKCRDIKGERKWDPDFGWFHRVTYQFEFRDDEDGNGFTLVIPSMGYRQLKGGAGNPVNVLDDNGAQVTDAVPLQKDGSYQPGKDPYLMQFQEFPSATFADLNIPDDILYIASGG